MFKSVSKIHNMRAFIYCILILYVLFPCVSFSSTSGTKTAATSGPYRSILVRVQKCEKATYPIEKDPPMDLTLEVYNSSTKNFLMRGNLNVFRENRQVKIKMKSFVWSDGKWKLRYLMNNVGCHGVLLHMLTMALGLNYNRETCGFDKGKYSFDNIDIDTLQHIWSTKMDYGKILWTSETTTLSTTYYCWEFETVVEPLEK